MTQDYGLGWAGGADQFPLRARWWLGHPVWGILHCPPNGHHTLIHSQNIRRQDKIFHVSMSRIPPAILLSQVQYWVWTSNHCKCRLSSIVSTVSRLYAFDTQIKLIQISFESFQSIWSLSQLQDLTPFKELVFNILQSLDCFKTPASSR